MAFLEVLSIALAALVTGVYWGPWVALTRTIATLEPAVFLPVVRRLSANLAPLMTALTPLSLLAIASVSILSWPHHRTTSVLNVLAFLLYALALTITLTTEVPIVKQIETWTPDTLPANWHRLRDRWVSFHLLRVVPGIAALTLLLTAAVLRG